MSWHADGMPRLQVGVIHAGDEDIY